jgi:hypothetical protein
MVARAGMTALAVAVIGILLSGIAIRAQTDEEKAMICAMGEVSGELQQCAVYFLVISACVS